MPHTTENQHVSDEEIARLYLSCKSLKKVAALINRSMKYVRETLEKLGVPINKRGIPKGTILPGKLTLKQREELRADLRAGKLPSLMAIGKKYGVTRECVRTIANKEGIFTYSRTHSATPRVRPQRAISPERAAYAARREALRPRFAELWKAGVRISDIAKELGLDSADQADRYLRYFRYYFGVDFPARPRNEAPQSREHAGVVNEGDSFTARLRRIVAAARRKKAEAETLKNDAERMETDPPSAEKQ